MLKHYLITALKNTKRYPLFSLINFFGLATAMAVCLMILLFVHRELTFDRFHKDAHDIYRISLHMNIQGEMTDEPVSSHATGPDILQEFPEVIEMTRLSHWYEPVTVWQDDNRHMSVEFGLYAESTFFDIFSFRLIRGNPQTSLDDPFTVVLSETLANELFPKTDPMGKVLRLGNRQQPYRVTGIIEDCPSGSHIRYNLLRSYPSLLETSGANFYEWDANINAMTYVKLAPGSDVAQLKEKTRPLTYEKVNYKFEGMGVNISIGYFPITDIRLHSPFSIEMVETGTISKVWIFSAVALFVLFIAGFNYVNLTIAKSGKRAREVGLRKVLGANKITLTTQFYTETLLITCISFILGLLLVEFTLPVFNHILDTQLSLKDTPWWSWLVILFIFVGVFGILAGIYPAWFMAAFQPIKTLKGELWNKPGKFQLRNLLLLIQFVVSMALIICTLVVTLQIRHLYTRDLGFKSQGLVVVETDSYEDATLLLHALDSYPWVRSQAAGSSFPGGHVYMEGVEIQDMEPGIMTSRIWLDYNYKDALDLQMYEGRWFSGDGEFEAEYVIVNQAFVRKTGWDDPIGKTVGRGGYEYQVIGVMKDFHYQSLHHDIEPLMVNILSARPNYLEMPYWVVGNYSDINESEVILAIGELWHDLFPNKALNNHFLSEHLESQYVNERSFGRLFMGFTILAIIIAMLGVLGLSSFIAQQKQKEMGIRKVLGASLFSILSEMAIGFVKWVLVAALIALPLAYWYMEKWLAEFAYAIGFPTWTLLAAFGAILILALTIVIIQSYRTANTSPVESLACE